MGGGDRDQRMSEVRDTGAAISSIGKDRLVATGCDDVGIGTHCDEERPDRRSSRTGPSKALTDLVVSLKRDSLSKREGGGGDTYSHPSLPSCSSLSSQKRKRRASLLPSLICQSPSGRLMPGAALQGCTIQEK